MSGDFYIRNVEVFWEIYFITRTRDELHEVFREGREDLRHASRPFTSVKIKETVLQNRRVAIRQNRVSKYILWIDPTLFG